MIRTQCTLNIEQRENKDIKRKKFEQESREMLIYALSVLFKNHCSTVREHCVHLCSIVSSVFMTYICRPGIDGGVSSLTERTGRQKCTER